MPRRTGETTERFWRDLLPAGPAVSSRRDKIFRSGSVVGCEARSPQNGHGSAGFDVLGPAALVTRDVHRASPESATTCIGRDSTTSGQVARHEESCSVKNFVLGFTVAILILPIGCLAYFAIGFSQTRADTKPSALETSTLQSAVRASVRRAAASVPNPPPANDDDLVAGGKLYVAGCQGCHGKLGGLYREDHELFPPTPQLPHTGTQYSEPELYWIVKHGIRMTGMSAYGPFYSEKELWSLAAFLHRIGKLSPGMIEKIRAKKAR